MHGLIILLLIGVAGKRCSHDYSVDQTVDKRTFETVDNNVNMHARAGAAGDAHV
jgi:hypothetical protein